MDYAKRKRMAKGCREEERGEKAEPFNEKDHLTGEKRCGKKRCPYHRKDAPRLSSDARDN